MSFNKCNVTGIFQNMGHMKEKGHLSLGSGGQRPGRWGAGGDGGALLSWEGCWTKEPPRSGIPAASPGDGSPRRAAGLENWVVSLGTCGTSSWRWKLGGSEVVGVSEEVWGDLWQGVGRGLGCEEGTEDSLAVKHVTSPLFPPPSSSSSHSCRRERHRHWGACTQTPASRGSASECAELTSLLWQPSVVSPRCPHLAGPLACGTFSAVTYFCSSPTLPPAPRLFSGEFLRAVLSSRE